MATDINQAGEKAPRDDGSVLFLGRFMMDQVGGTWGIEPIKESATGSSYKFTRCKSLDLAREAGIETLDMCRAHERYWQTMGDSLEGRPNFHFVQMMKYGAPYCIATIEPPARAPRQSADTARLNQEKKLDAS